MDNADAQRLTSASFSSSPQPLSVSVPSLRTLMANRLHQRDHTSSQIFSQLIAAQTRSSFQRATSLPLMAEAARTLASPPTPLSVASGFSPDRARDGFGSRTRHFNHTAAFPPSDSTMSSPISLLTDSAVAESVSSSTNLRRSSRLARQETSACVEVDTPSTSSSRKRGAVKTLKQFSPRKRQKGLKEPPSSSSHSVDDLDTKPSAVESTCTICLCEPDKMEISSLDGCNHLFCFSCIEKWSERENSCPLCKCRFSRITRMNPQRRRKGTSGSRNTKKVKSRDQRADMPTSAAIEGLLASLAQGGAFPGSSRLSRMFATQLSVPIVRNRTARANAPAPAGRIGVTMLHPSMNLEDDDDTSLLGFMQAVLRSHREGHHSDIPGEMHVFPAGGNVFSSFGVVPNPVSSRTTSRSHASNENDLSAGRAIDNPLEIDDSDDDVEFIHIS